MEIVFSILNQLDDKRSKFEDKYGIDNICFNITDIFSENFEHIPKYREYIRCNEWYFPVIEEDDLLIFTKRFLEIHEYYNRLAEEIYSFLVVDNSRDGLLANFFEKVIKSETMRGWVGKRSPSGLDNMIEKRCVHIEDILGSFLDSELIDDFFKSFGVSKSIETAEEELIYLLSIFESSYDKLLSIHNFNEAISKSNGAVTKIMRFFSKYSLNDFNKKYLEFKKKKREKIIFDKKTVSEEYNLSFEEVVSQIKCMEKEKKLRKLVKEVQILNALNLNIEAKFSFKGWAGLMHNLVIEEARKKVNTNSTDIYMIKNHLKTGEVKWF